MATADMETTNQVAEPPTMMRVYPGLGLLQHYHLGGNFVLAAGILTGIITHEMGVLSPWAGFLVGVVPAFLITAAFYAFKDGD